MWEVHMTTKSDQAKREDCAAPKTQFTPTAGDPNASCGEIEAVEEQQKETTPNGN